MNNASKSFNSTPKPRLLYHASTSNIKGRIEARENDNALKTERARFVFASPSLDGAYGYALKTNGCILQSNNLMLFNNRDDFIKQNPRGYIYALKPDLFENVINTKTGQRTGEWVARQNVDLEKYCTNIIQVSGINAAMDRGIQFLFLTQKDDEKTIKKIYEADSPEVIRELIESGKATWENGQRGIKPDPAFTA